MSEEKKPMEPDLKRKLYTMRIDVYPSAQVFGLEDIEKDYDLHTQHIIGMLEVVKGAYLREHGAKVAELYKKSTENPEPLPTNTTEG